MKLDVFAKYMQNETKPIHHVRGTQISQPLESE
jgi:hypothetical protein